MKKATGKDKAYWRLSEKIRKALGWSLEHLDAACKTCKVIQGKRYSFTPIHTEVLNDIRPTIRVTPKVGSFTEEWYRHNEGGLAYFHVPPRDLVADIVNDAEDI
jgi:hypothetical protein